MYRIFHENLSLIGQIVLSKSCQPGQKTLFRETTQHESVPETLRLLRLFTPVLEISDQNSVSSKSSYFSIKKIMNVFAKILRLGRHFENTKA